MAGNSRSVLPWDDLLTLLVGTGRLSPREFWTITPRELAAIVGLNGDGSATAAPARADLEALMRHFPDRNSPLEPIP